MAQLTLYIDDDTSKRMRAAAQAAGVSLSKWVTNLVRERTASEWPADVLALAGAWKDEDIAAPDRGANPPDALREVL